MLLYHLSFDPVKKFIPRVPKFRCPNENATIPRICLSDSIEKAITALPHGGQALRGMLSLKDKIAPVLHLYVCDESINPLTYKPPTILQIKYGVYDACYTHEWWAIETPNFIHKIIILKSAAIHDVYDDNGKLLSIVDSIDYSLLSTLPKNAPEILFSSVGIDIRTIYNEIDENKEFGNKIRKICLKYV